VTAISGAFSCWRDDREYNLGQLTDREREVLGKLAQGFLYQEVADLLAINLETVRVRTETLNKVFPR
jgi:DNA-binding NarL/FixJ family response regulator